MSLADRDLSHYVQRTTTEADLTRQWRQLAPTLDRPARRGVGWAVALGATCVAGAIALMLVAGKGEPPTLPTTTAVTPFLAEGTRLVNDGQTPRELRLVDGSLVALGRGGVLALGRGQNDDIRLVLERGNAEFDVTHVAGRRFVVTAADVDVVVVGTHFSVSVSDGAQGTIAAVSVQRGAVEVRRPHRPAQLFLPGQSWSSASTEEPPAVETPPAPAIVRSRSVPPHGKPVPTEDSQTLFAAATAARLQGKHREAATALEKFYRRFPGDPRAPLAAFALGRIQLDELHETAQAATSFHAAAKLARDPALCESAATREIEALDRSGDRPACRAARDAYRAAYPTGPHLGRVTASCRER